MHLLVVRAPPAIGVALALTPLGRREEGAVCAEDHVAPVVPVPPRVLHPLELLGHALGRTACGARVSGVAHGRWRRRRRCWAVCEASRGRDGMGRAARFFEPPSPSMKHSLSKQARASVGCSWQEGACCGRGCRGFAAAHRWSSVPSGQTEVTVQSFSPFVAAPTSATSAKRLRTSMWRPPRVQQRARRGGIQRNICTFAINITKKK